MFWRNLFKALVTVTVCFTLKTFLCNFLIKIDQVACVQKHLIVDTVIFKTSQSIHHTRELKHTNCI